MHVHAIPNNVSIGRWLMRRILPLLSVLLVCAHAHAADIPTKALKKDLAESSATSPKLPTVAVPAEEDAVGKPVPATAPLAQGQNDPAVPRPFGSNLFMGNFLRTRQNGMNPSYEIMPGDQVALSTWGAVELNTVLVVDSQGNVFLPGIGPIRLQGVRSGQVTDRVKSGLQRVFKANLEVYTNLITANPVAVFVTGSVPRPGRYAGIPSDSILFFLDQAGGIDPELGSYRRVNVLRSGVGVVASVDLYDFLLTGNLPQIQFVEGDTILVERRGPVVELRGDVAHPVLLEFSPGVALTGAEALKIIPSKANATHVTLFGLRDGTPINRTLSLRGFESFNLVDGDKITIRQDGHSDMIVVHVEGEFDGPSELAVRRGSRLVDVLNHIPVRRDFAEPTAVHLKRNSVAKAQRDSLTDAVFRLERSALLALSQSNGESNIRAKEAELALQFAERARLVQPLGRVVTSRDNVQQNVLLEDGDIIVVPSRTNVVRVGGEVMMDHALMFQPGMTAEDYIERAGGLTDRADVDKVILIHANAEVTVGEPDIEVLPGDEVLVPPRVDVKTLQNVADITQIIYQVAVSAAVVLDIL